MADDLQIGDVVLRPLLGQIRGPNRRCHLEPRSVDVLLLLCSRPGEVISRGEILAKVWSDRNVGESAVTRCIFDIRRAFRRASSQGNPIETVPKRGYRLVIDVALEGVACLPELAPMTEAALDTILEGTSERVFVLSPKGVYLRASRVGAGAVGFEPGEMVGKTWRALGLPPEIMEPFERDLKTVVSEGRVLTKTVGYPTIDGMKSYEYRLRPAMRSGTVCCVLVWVTRVRRPA